MAWDKHTTQHDCDNMQRAKKAVSYSTWDKWILLSGKWIFCEVFWGGIQIKDAL